MTENASYYGSTLLTLSRCIETLRLRHGDDCKILFEGGRLYVLINRKYVELVDIMLDKTYLEEAPNEF